MYPLQSGLPTNLSKEVPMVGVKDKDPSATGEAYFAGGDEAGEERGLSHRGNSGTNTTKTQFQWDNNIGKILDVMA